MTEAAGAAEEDVVTETVEDGDFHIPEVSARTILMGSGPRFARDAFGPMLVFYAGYKLSGLLLGIVASTLASFIAYRWERSHDRPGLMARVGLFIVLVQAVIGVVSDSTVVYLAQPVLINGAYGLAFIGSALIGRPLAGAFATEMYEFPEEVKSSVTFRNAFRNVSLAWGLYLVLRSVVRLATLSNGDVDAFILVNLLTGVPFTALLMGWSVWYAVRFFRNSAEWGEAIKLLEAAA
ncbi:MAG: hypothetical protein QOD38_2129 [Acidimicrobiaceae bacterium]